MAKVETSRRGILGAVAVVAMAGTATMAALPALPSPAALGDRTAWDRAMLALQAAQAATDADDHHWLQAHYAYEAAKPDPSGIDMHAFRFCRREYIAHEIDLEKEWADWLAREGQTWFSNNRDETIAREKASYDSVREYRRKIEEADRAAGYTEANERADRLGEALADAYSALIALPAPDGPALLWKLKYLLDGSAWSHDFTAQTIADAERLLSGGLN